MSNDIQVTYEQVDSLVPYAMNAKKHSEKQVGQIANSIRSFGFVNPVLVASDNTIIAGHGRVLAAKRLGLKVIPTIRLSHLTEAQRKAYIIADNRLAETGGGWDLDRLRAELATIDFADLGDFQLQDLELDQLGIGGQVIENVKDEWRNMPEFKQKDELGIRCTVHFDDEADKARFEELVGQKIPTNTNSIWFPPKEWISMKGVRYENEEDRDAADRADAEVKGLQE